QSIQNCKVGASHEYEGVPLLKHQDLPGVDQRGQLDLDHEVSLTTTAVDPGHRFGGELGPQCLVGTFEDIRHTHRTTSPYLEFFWLKFIDSPPRGQGCCEQPLMPGMARSEEHTSELQSRFDLVC